MKVTQQTLPLFNEMYELKFSEDEMQKAFSVHDEVIEKLKDLGKPFKNTSVGTISHIIDNGVNTITHTMYVSDSWEGRLEIHAGHPDEEDDEEEGKETLPATTTSYFELRPEFLTGGGRNCIKVKTIVPEQLYTLLENLHYCSEMEIHALNDEEIEKHNGIEVYDDLTWLIEVTNGPRIFEKIKAEELNDGLAINSSKEFDDSFDKIIEMCDWLLPGAKKTETKDDVLEKQLLSENFGDRGEALGYIEGILEKDNHRLGIISLYTKDHYRKSSYRRLFLLNHEDDLFNYADIDRICVIDRRNHYSYTTIPISKTGVFGKLLFTEEVTLPTREALQWIVRHITGNDTQLYDASQLKLSVKKFSEDIRRKKEEEDEKKALETKLKQKIETIKAGKKLILNGMTIKKDSIEYEEQILKRSDKADWVYTSLLRLSRAYKFDDINWDSVFEEFIRTISRENSKGEIGDVSFALRYEESTNRANITSTKTYLNDHRINKMEILDCLRRAVCYETQEDFNEFLSNVSSCSLKFHRYLQTGVDFQVSGMRYNEGFSFKLPLERRKNLMYIVLGDNEYKVRDTNRLINTQNMSDLGEIMELLLGDKVIEGMTIDDAKSVLKLAKIEFQSAIDKSKKLLEETEKTLKLEKRKDIQMNEITVREGYIVNGKLRQYVVANSEKCEVYEYPSGRYICIVDKSTSQVGKIN